MPPPPHRHRLSVHAFRPDHRRLRFETLEDRRLLATFTVTDLDDGPVFFERDPTTLRAAVFQANNSAGPDQIVFEAGLEGTILLTEGELEILESVDIIGPGAGVITIEAFDPTPDEDNADGSRLFNVDDGDESTLADVAISGLTLTGGDSDGTGGAIRSTENLNIQRSHVTDNSAIGFIAAGGGIYQIYGELTIVESTISNNRAISEGIRAVGGAIAVSEADLTLRNSTVSGNQARGIGGPNAYGGGIALTAGPISAAIVHSTIANNGANSDESRGGGIFVAEDVAVTLDHTIVADNIAFRGNVDSGQQISSSSAVAARFSIVEDSGGWVVDDRGDNIFDEDAGLLNLADNGGPTPTHALQVDSPAVDSGSELVVDGSMDQRGTPFARAFDGDGSGTRRRDMGAYERQTVAGLAPVVDTVVDEIDGNYGPGDLSLREAVGLANGSIGPDTITFDPSLSGERILLTMGELLIFDSVTIDGATNSASVTIDASGNDPTPDENLGDGTRVFNIDDQTDERIDVTLSGLTFTGGDVQSRGGAILSRENLTITRSTIRNNFSGNEGGGLHQSEGVFRLEHSTVSDNSVVPIESASGSGAILLLGGGGLWVIGAPSEIVSSTISGNHASSAGVAATGGGIAFGYASLTIRHSTISGNRAEGNSAAGGNIYFHSGNADFVLDHTIVADGSADQAADIGTVVDPVTANFSLIEDATDLLLLGTGNITGQDPRLGPLADHGGPTRTHALLPGSPAIDRGDIAFSPPPDTDQRGGPFVRVFNGDGDAFTIVDIGAYERQTVDGLDLVVDTLADESDGDYAVGDLSLREAVGLANGSVGGDAITFAPELVGTTILLQHGEMRIADDVSIDATGLGGTLTIDASGSDTSPQFNNGEGSRIFNVDEGDDGTLLDVELSGLTLTGGDVVDTFGGGAILNAENLTVNQSTITGNSAQGVLSFPPGETFITVGGRGGGIGVRTGGSLTLVASTVHSNFASFGGGLAATDGQLTINFSTISSNSTTEDGGGIWVDGNNANLTASHSTIARNDPGGTAAAAGGGVWAGEINSFNLNHTVVADNSAPANGPDIFSAVDVSFVNSLVENGSGFSAVGGLQLIGIDPLLGPLLDNGGPTLTHALAAESPAIDAGQIDFAPPPAFDQRGGPFVRIFDGDNAFGARIDIGAYERQSLPDLNLVVDTLSDLTDEDFSSGNLSLREAVKLANGSIGDDAITFDEALDGTTILLVQRALNVIDSVSIDAGGLAQGVTVDAGGSDPTPAQQLGDGSRVLRIDDNNSANLIDVELIRLTLTGGDVDGSGGGILNAENLTLIESTISDNAASAVSGFGSFVGVGGGIAHALGALLLDGSTISNNSALGSGEGGGIYIVDTPLFRATNTTVSGNFALDDGGGIFLDSITQADINHSTISSNEAASEGGGIAVRLSALALNHSIVANNVAPSGPDIFGGTVPVIYSLVEDSSNFTPDGGPRILGVDPMLGPLADNGGPTQTHALLPGSPAIDMGEQGVDSPPLFDQRGNGFPRIVDGNNDTAAVIDIGAFEFNPGSPVLLGDYHMDGRVNAADYIVWRNTEGDSVTPFSGADGNGNGLIDDGDYQVWRDHFGNTLPPGAASGDGAKAADDQSADAVGAVLGFMLAPGEAASAVVQVLRDSFNRPSAPPAVDAALLVLLAERDGPASELFSVVAPTVESSRHEQGRDDLFAELLPNFLSLL